MSRRTWPAVVTVVGLFVGFPLAFAVLLAALALFGPYGVAFGIISAAGVVFLAGLSHEWWQNWRAERRRSRK
jgi:threonine/homoserine/homoserine lactone efflux protein